MKRAFLEPGMEVIKFQDEDIITKVFLAYFK